MVVLLILHMETIVVTTTILRIITNIITSYLISAQILLFEIQNDQGAVSRSSAHLAVSAVLGKHFWVAGAGVGINNLILLLD